MSAAICEGVPQGEFTQTMNTAPEESRKRTADEATESPLVKRIADRLAGVMVSRASAVFKGVRVYSTKVKKNNNVSVNLQGPKLVADYLYKFPGHCVSTSTKNMTSEGRTWTIKLELKPAAKNTTAGLNPDFGPAMTKIADDVRVDLLESWGFGTKTNIEATELLSFLAAHYGGALGTTYIEMFVMYVAQGCLGSGLDPAGAFEVGQPSAKAKTPDAIQQEHYRLTKIILTTPGDVANLTQTIYAYDLPDQSQSNGPGQMQVKKGRSIDTVIIDYVLMHPEAIRFYVDKNGGVRGELTWRVKEIHAHTEA